MTIHLSPLTDAAMAGFGAVIRAPSNAGERSGYTAWLGSERLGTTPRLHVNLVRPTALPYRIDKLERHPHTAQIFVPLDVERYVVVVAPSYDDGSPDLTRLRGFISPGNLGVVYGQGVWHAGATVLDRPGSFGVLMWRNDSPDDEEFVALGQAIEVTI